MRSDEIHTSKIGHYWFRQSYGLSSVWHNVIVWIDLTHWGRVTHICVSKLITIGSDRRQAIIWTNDGILLIGPLGTKFSEILIESYTFSFKKMHLKMSSGKWRLLRLGLKCVKSQSDRRNTFQCVFQMHKFSFKKMHYIRQSLHNVSRIFQANSSFTIQWPQTGKIHGVLTSQNQWGLMRYTPAK